jgi:hypothetical protein
MLSVDDGLGVRHVKLEMLPRTFILAIGRVSELSLKTAPPLRPSVAVAVQAPPLKDLVRVHFHAQMWVDSPRTQIALDLI